MLLRTFKISYDGNNDTICFRRATFRSWIWTGLMWSTSSTSRSQLIVGWVQIGCTSMRKERSTWSMRGERACGKQVNFQSHKHYILWFLFIGFSNELSRGHREVRDMIKIAHIMYIFQEWRDVPSPTAILRDRYGKWFRALGKSDVRRGFSFRNDEYQVHAGESKLV